ncbi:DNA topoisomerase IA subunit omega [Fadolivirus algeromassiliense]|jgi:DNA topoisomerase-1|uniref:DNA topoisomerase n=1 Tax=Fadolivirus FV1/VV64 TaxID=3070911 RepID=A0A7D3UQT6_9VIRU|nr:DNA topoisomerase IA subunit omega [Fadolivirus algeromassiliense]QKF94073.1 DNA topoisomerase IA subunit omega [Fadolivirus FV1/VV64]
MIVLFVESPNKTKKIEHLLGEGYRVAASVGHIMDLDPKKMSIEIDNGFKPIYIINTDKTTVVKNLKQLAKNAGEILLATDEDREGEMIAWSIADVLGLKNPKRITFNEITKAALEEAVKNPRQIDTNMVNAQKARRILDRIVGYELSPLLDKHLGQKSLSAGRVQSVVARLIVDRENEIKKFFSDELKSFFRFKGEFVSDGKAIKAGLYDVDGKNADGSFKGSQSKLDGETRSREFLTNCTNAEFKVEHVFDKKRTQGPSAPFTTSTLQQDANRKFGFSIKRTMTAAQHLYEAGYITYMRTDSVNLSEECLENIKKYVIENHGNEYYKRTEYKSKTKNAQEAHEAVRPTDVYTTDVEIGGKINDDEKRLYNLIWKRSVASQMKHAEFNVTSIQISINNEKEHFFMTKIENLTFAGFLAVYNIENIEKDEDEDEDVAKNIKVPKVGQTLTTNNIIGTQEYIKPPGRYNYASLVAKLDPDNLNIGRPATYGAIIEKIIERCYIESKDTLGVEVDSLVLTWNNNSSEDNISENTNKIVLGKEKNKFVPTHLGILVTNFLLSYFPNIMDYQFTATMEDKLDEIANGNLEWNNVLKDFYDEFHPLVLNILLKNPEIEDKYTKLLGADPKSGGEIYATMAKYGPVVKLVQKAGKPKYAPIKEPLTLESIKIDDALKLFEYPKELGKYERKKVLLNRGQYGFYITVGTQRISVDNENITLIDAIEAIKNKTTNKALNTFTSGTRVYSILDGQYGKYVNVFDGKTKKKFNVSLPKDEDVDNITLDRINEIIKNKFDKYKTPPKNNKQNIQESEKVPAKTVPAKKAPTKKAPTKVPAKKAGKVTKKIIKKAANKNIQIEKN